MRSFYGKECPKHPEWAGRRYLPSGCCIGCQRQLNRDGNARRRDQLKELIAAAMESPQTIRLTKALEAMGYEPTSNTIS